MFIVKSVQKSWLTRTINVSTPRGLYEIIYNGQGLGYEEVLVNGQTVSRSSQFWFVPKFEFYVGKFPAEIEVDISVLLRIKSFKLEIDGENVYSE